MHLQMPTQLHHVPSQTSPTAPYHSQNQVPTPHCGFSTLRGSTLANPNSQPQTQTCPEPLVTPASVLPAPAVPPQLRAVTLMGPSTQNTISQPSSWLTPAHPPLLKTQLRRTFPAMLDKASDQSRLLLLPNDILHGCVCISCLPHRMLSEKSGHRRTHRV